MEAPKRASKERTVPPTATTGPRSDQNMSWVEMVDRASLTPAIAQWIRSLPGSQPPYPMPPEGLDDEAMETAHKLVKAAPNGTLQACWPTDKDQGVSKS